MHLETSDIIIFINDIDTFTFKLSHYINYSIFSKIKFCYSESPLNLNILSPELINCDDKIYKTDIWSLGVIIYYMLNKEYPYGNGRSEYQVIKYHFLDLLSPLGIVF